MSNFEDLYMGHGGAVLVDESCGSASLTTSAGETISFRVDHDPEYVMSGVTEPCMSHQHW